MSTDILAGWIVGGVSMVAVIVSQDWCVAAGVCVVWVEFGLR